MMDPIPARDQGDLSLYLEARNYIDLEVVRLEPRLSDPDGKVATVRAFNQDLGNPQTSFRSVQVAGTSGKGSTSTWLARILHACGVSTGLHVSPYLQAATEKTWIDGRYAAPRPWHEAYLRVRPVSESYRLRADCRASVHGMTSLAVTYECFRHAGIGWAVMETGVGGRYDLIQGLDRRLAVITDIGLDHLKTLGEDLQTIAWHKAGIMEGAPRALATYDPQVWPVFEEQAARCGCRLEPLRPEEVASLHDGPEGPVVRLKLPSLGNVEIPWPFDGGGFRLRNFAVAACAADMLSDEGVRLTPEALAASMTAGPVPGRMETVQTQPRVILDAAHNPQKMQALMRSLFPGTGALGRGRGSRHRQRRGAPEIPPPLGAGPLAPPPSGENPGEMPPPLGAGPLAPPPRGAAAVPTADVPPSLPPPPSGEARRGDLASALPPPLWGRPGGGISPRFLLVLAATGDRAVEEFAAVFPVRPDVLVLTRPLLYGKKVSSPDELAIPLRGWAGRTLLADTPAQAMQTVLSEAHPEDLVLATGSIYMVGQARDRWYPWEQVVLQGTSFPK